MTMYKKMLTATAIAGMLGLAGPADAQSHQRSGGGRSISRAVPRTGPSSRVLVSRPYFPGYYRTSFYRPYYYPGFRFGFAFGYPFGYPYGYYPYGYPYYAYGYPGYSDYGYPAPGYIVAGRPYGSVRIKDAPKDAEVFADGYYAGTVDDFDGVFHHLNLEPGPHRIEIRAQGHEPLAFEVRVEPGQTVTYRAAMRQ